MIPLCPLEVWCSSGHAPLRSTRGFVNNSAADYSISLKFYRVFVHTMPEVPQKFKVKGSKVNVTARRNANKNLPNCE